MKPKIFIGSSVEGLSVAYAIQQNLLHDVESTVWDQGVFDLSSTTIESLSKVLTSSDFGIFVFSPDDVVKIRNKESLAVRDNVIFEMGLFIGKLGRERVFFVVPSATDLHIPTDLLGVTPGKYDTNRSDGSMQAATGPVSHQIRTQIKTLGHLNPDKSAPNEPLVVNEGDSVESHWIYDFVDKKYDSAIEKIKLSIGLENGMSQGNAEAWIANCELKKNENNGVVELSRVSKKFRTEVDVQVLVASFLRTAKYTNVAAGLLADLPEDIIENSSIRIAIAECHASNEDGEKAIEFLNKSDPAKNPDVAIYLAKLQMENDEKSAAFSTLIAAYSNNSRHVELRYEISKLAIDQNQNEIALYLLDELTVEFPSSPNYWGYLGNCCLALNITDHAMISYRSAEKLAPDSSKSWIVSNIGNLYYAKGFPSEAINHLKRSVELDNNSDYAHDRLAGALKLRETMRRSMLKTKKEGAHKLKTLCGENGMSITVVE